MGSFRAWIDRNPPVRRFIYFFPVQLLLVQVKKNPVLIIFWLLMFGFVSGKIAARYGVPLLFMDPEYLGEVNFFSYFLVGFACGGFVMAYQISCYNHNAFRFPFLATLSRPFLRFCINNFIIPCTFLIYYLVHIIIFLQTEPVTKLQILEDVTGFALGNVVFIFSSLFYFFRANKDMQSLYGIIKDPSKTKPKRVILNRDPKNKTLRWKTITPGKENRDWHVESYISSLTTIRRARPFEHYEKEMLNRVFVQNHGKSVLFEVIVIITLLIFGFFRQVPALMIPAGASVFLLFTLYLMLTGVISTWFRGWANAVLVILLLVINVVAKYDFFGSHTRALGMNYAVKPAIYSNDEFNRFIASGDWRKEDSLNTIAILEKWKTKNSSTIGSKPKMIVMSCSGGGLRSTFWTFYTMQYLDSLSAGKMLPRTALICGSSGGMLGAAYMREIWLREQTSIGFRHDDPALREKISTDVLNPIAFSLAVNDWFLPLRHANYEGNTYSRNRAYAFEETILQNTDNVLEKKLGDYREPEREAKIPMMVFAPTIANDGRKMVISAQGVSYLTQPAATSNVTNNYLADGIEFSRFFHDQGADNVRFASVLRMNATFPYITPLTDLPSEPVIQVFDAGMRDNFGMDNIMRFMYTFREWIAANTSGIILLQTRDKSKIHPIEKTPDGTIMNALARPLKSFYGNLFTVQDYQHDYEIEQSSHWFAGKIDVIDFELMNDEPDIISLSWHLTRREKNRVMGSMNSPKNKLALQKFLDLLKEEVGSSTFQVSTPDFIPN
ncbi:MAG: patatin-like phospholipase family protein [Bacteroidota bacterium]|nr:patatin-like phospholipase family protein [Bacteroidota bacterium]